MKKKGRCLLACFLVFCFAGMCSCVKNKEIIETNTTDFSDEESQIDLSQAMEEGFLYYYAGDKNCKLYFDRHIFCFWGSGESYQTITEFTGKSGNVITTDSPTLYYLHSPYGQPVVEVNDNDIGLLQDASFSLVYRFYKME